MSKQLFFYSLIKFSVLVIFLLHYLVNYFLYLLGDLYHFVSVFLFIFLKHKVFYRVFFLFSFHFFDVSHPEVFIGVLLNEKIFQIAVNTNLLSAYRVFEHLLHVGLLDYFFQAVFVVFMCCTDLLILDINNFLNIFRF